MNTKRLNSSEVIPPDYFGRLWDDIRACEISGDGTTTRVDRSSGGATISAIVPGMAAAAPAGYEIIVPAISFSEVPLTKGRAVVLSYNQNGRFVIESSAHYHSRYYLGVLVSNCPAAEVGKIAPAAFVMVQGCTTSFFDVPQANLNYGSFNFFTALPNGNIAPSPCGMTAGTFSATAAGIIEIPVLLTFRPLEVDYRDFCWSPRSDGLGISVDGGYVHNYGSIPSKSFLWSDLDLFSGADAGVWLCFDKDQSSAYGWKLVGFGKRVSCEFDIQLTDGLRQLKDGMLFLPQAE